MKIISINFILPENWQDMSDKKLRYVYELIAQDFNTDEVKTLCLLRWTGTKVIGKRLNNHIFQTYPSKWRYHF